MVEMWQIYFMPYAHFWFLQAIILIFALVGGLDRFGAMRKLSGYSIVLAGALVLHFFVVIYPSIYSSNQALYLPFFIAGLGANRFGAAMQWPPFKYVCLVVFVVLMTLHTLAVYHIYGEVAERRTYIGTTLSLTGLMTLLFWIPPSRTLAWSGGFSFTIYLYHVFFTGGTRAVLARWDYRICHSIFCRKRRRDRGPHHRGDGVSQEQFPEALLPGAIVAWR